MKEPRFCGLCGTELVETTRPRGYDRHTGEERPRSILRHCPQRDINVFGQSRHDLWIRGRRVGREYWIDGDMET